jgi:hypothetical protein
MRAGDMFDHVKSGVSDYAASGIAPDGHNLEAVCHEPAA